MASGAASSCRSPSQPATDASLTEDRLGETTPVQIFHPLIRIDSEEEEEEEDEKRSCFTVSSSSMRLLENIITDKIIRLGGTHPSGALPMRVWLE